MEEFIFTPSNNSFFIFSSQNSGQTHLWTILEYKSLNIAENYKLVRLEDEKKKAVNNPEHSLRLEDEKTVRYSRFAVHATSIFAEQKFAEFFIFHQ